jgi:hypothetical protein
MGKTSGTRKRQRVQSENQAESRSGNVCLRRQGMATRLTRDWRHSTSVPVDCPGKGALPAIGDSGSKTAGTDALRRGWIGLR